MVVVEKSSFFLGERLSSCGFDLVSDLSVSFGFGHFHTPYVLT